MKKRCNLLLNFLFYFLLLLLLYVLIYPHSSIGYRKPVIQPFAHRLNETDVTLRVGETFHLYLVGLNKRASYESSDFKVASVDLSGHVRAWRKGTAIIRVKNKNGTLKCRIRVTS